MDDEKPDNELPPTVGQETRKVTRRLARAMKFDPEKARQAFEDAEVSFDDPDDEQLAEAVLRAREEVRENALPEILRDHKAIKGNKLGARSRSGRRNGRKTKEKPVLNVMRHKLEKVAERVLDTIYVEGETPLDFLLRQMRSTKNKLPVRIQCAVSAAPYVHPRLAFIQHRTPSDSNAVKRILDMLEEEKRTINGQALEAPRLQSQNAVSRSEQNPLSPAPSPSPDLDSSSEHSMPELAASESSTRETSASSFPPAGQ